MPTNKSARPSPPYPAKDYKKIIKLGNDKKQYISLPDKNGIYKWKKYTKTKTSTKTQTRKVKVNKYYPHDNGARYLLVEDYPELQKVVVYKIQQETPNKKLLETKYTEIFLNKPPKKIFNDPIYGHEKGSSILLKLSANNYLFIGDTIFKFKTKNQDKILYFVSPIGNSDVVYPYAVGVGYTYLLLADDKFIYLDNNLLVPNKSAYDQYYKYSLKLEQYNYKKNKITNKLREELKEEISAAKIIADSAKKYPVKILYSRDVLSE
jgi:hypothetical protein